jgi:hypothetical protein
MIRFANRCKQILLQPRPQRLCPEIYDAKVTAEDSHNLALRVIYQPLADVLWHCPANASVTTRPTQRR